MFRFALLVPNQVINLFCAIHERQKCWWASWHVVHFEVITLGSRQVVGASNLVLQQFRRLGILQSTFIISRITRVGLSLLTIDLWTLLYLCSSIISLNFHRNLRFGRRCLLHLDLLLLNGF